MKHRNYIHVFSVLLLLVVLTAGVPASAQTSPSATPSVADRTILRLYAPFTDMGGSVSVGLAITEKLNGTCFAGSVSDVARADAFRCMAGNRILDPCFVPNPTATVLLCVAEPISKANVVQLTITGGLPTANKTVTFDKALPWALELANGQTCQLLTGATSAIADLRVNYGCDRGDGLAVIGDPDRAYPLWTIFVRGPKDFFAEQVPITVAWY